MNTTTHNLLSGLNLVRLISPVFVVAVLEGLSACADTDKDQGVTATLDTTPIQVFKSPTYRRCDKWVEHMEFGGFDVTAKNRQNLNAIKQGFGIKPRYQACHTGVAEGYVFEGHIPASLVQRFLDEKPTDAIGLAVPGMPVGSPGMEMGHRFDSYDVLLLKADGSSEVYAHISGPGTMSRPSK